jgi:hypothetical protein
MDHNFTCLRTTIFQKFAGALFLNSLGLFVEFGNTGKVSLDAPANVGIEAALIGGYKFGRDQIARGVWLRDGISCDESQLVAVLFVRLEVSAPV